MSRQLGIDEAGRGPVLGPLVLAGLVLTPSEAELLAKLGVQDSKLLGATAKQKKRRIQLSEQIQKDFEFKIISCPSQTVDQWVRNESLNRLEIDAATQIMEALEWDSAVLDGKNLFHPLENAKVQAHNKADLDYVSVAGASILAKVSRDAELEELLQPFTADYGIITGGGYPNGQTLKFVLWHLKHFQKLPSFYRTSYQWKALQQSL